MMATYSVAIVAFPSSGPSGHLLPDGEKNPENAAIAPARRGRVDRLQAETGEGGATKLSRS